ncbi:MAG: hypothetical protein PHV85_00215 [Desulfovibrionaceae bacterium]|nr:hypothetical protein [Desulfovibrionaceae bacterium]
MGALTHDLGQVVERLERLANSRELLPSERAALRGARGAVAFIRDRRKGASSKPDWREAQLPTGDRL